MTQLGLTQIEALLCVYMYMLILHTFSLLILNGATCHCPEVIPYIKC